MKLWKLGSMLLLAATGCFAATTTSLGAENGGSSTGDGGADEDAETLDGNTARFASGPCENSSSEEPVAPCPPGQYCKSTTPGACSSGTCQKLLPPPPPSCMALECGCDGVIRCLGYTTSSWYGVDVHGDSTACNMPCGPSLFCDPTKTFCQHTVGGAQLPDGAPGIDDYTCEDLPDVCNFDPNCDCLKEDLPDRVCTSDDKGRIYANRLAP